MPISRSQLLKELLPGLNGLFGLSYKTYENQHTEIFSTESSDRSFEEETKLSGFGAAPVKSEGSSINYDSAQEAFTARYTHETIAMGFSITEEAIEDNLYDSLSARYTKALARAMAYTKQVKAAAVLNNAFSGSFLGGDTVSLCGVNSGSSRVGHPLSGGGSNYNSPAVGVDLNETAIEAAVIQLQAWVDERGLLVAAKPRKLIVPPAYQFIVKRVLGSDLRQGTADNDLNALKALGTIGSGYAINNFLTDTNAWFMLTDVPDGLKMFQRVGMKTAMEGDFDTGNVRYKARERYSFGWSDPLAIWGSSGST
jgi:hypothetical protein